jgi:mevalonate kinase
MKAIAPGKLILSGEHAVVYGGPALAMAIDRNAQTIVTAAESAGPEEVRFELPDVRAVESFTLRALRDFRERVQRNYDEFTQGRMGLKEILRKPVDLFQYTFITILDGLHLKLTGGLEIRMHSTIPIGCGLGSSAATILSVLRAVGHYFRVEFRPDWYYRYSLEAERLQHGFPSGVDSFVSLHGGCALFREGEAKKIPLPRLCLRLADTGTPECTTGDCVAEVRRRFGASSIWTDFERTTLAMTEALRQENTDAFRAAMRDNHRLLCEIGVVPEKVRAFVAEIERRGGAAKISGAGAIRGEAAGAVLVCADSAVDDVFLQFGYRSLSFRGEPLGVRIV